MTRSQPPALAMRLMRDAETDPAVIGDLVEAYSSGRSNLWFWKQAIAAIVPTPLNAVRWAVAIPLACETHRLLGGIHWLQPIISNALAFAAFVFVGTLVVPSRKHLVARCLFGVVCFLAGFVVFRSFLFPSQLSIWVSATGLSSFLGALAAYRLTPTIDH